MKITVFLKEKAKHGSRLLFIILFSCVLLLISCSSITGNKHIVINMLIEKTASSTEIAAMQDIIKQRLIAYGISEDNIEFVVTDSLLVINISHADNAERVVALVTATGKLEFWETYEYTDVYPILNKAQEIIKANQDTLAIDTTLKDKSIEDLIDDKGIKYARENPLFNYLQPAIVQDANGDYYPSKGPVVGYCGIADTARVGEMLRDSALRFVFPRDLHFAWTIQPVSKESPFLQLLALKTSSDGKAALVSGVIIDSQVNSGENNMPEIQINMNSEGAAIWKKMTANNIGNSIAIVFDNYVFSFPTVQSEIPNGRSVITGNFAMDEAKDLAAILRFNPLPVQFITKEVIVTDEK